MGQRVSLIRQAYAAWSRGDLDGMLELLDPDVHYWSSGVFPGLADSYRGHEGMRRFWADFHDMWQSIEINPIRFEEEGDLVVALWEFDGVGRGGVHVERQGAQIARFDGDLVVRVKTFGDWDSALAVLRDERSTD